LLKHEAPQASEKKYVAVMPLPVKDLDEWRRLYMDAKPDATPEDVAWHENLAKQIIENEPRRRRRASHGSTSTKEDEQ
jgi:hypothetical protein